MNGTRVGSAFGTGGASLANKAGEAVDVIAWREDGDDEHRPARAGGEVGVTMR
ncbi:hypothetical protein [Burkholderia territorii]|uniref:hypothetical protein n=1 Tax=Burkholderia territorii TaxID=1503055 RepID=UPI000B2F2524|nr:hypothetical protein [Burkholderia territorii]